MLRDVEGKELPLRQAAVLQRIAVIFRLGKISLVELALVSDDEAAGLQRDDIGLERGRVHRDQQVGFVARGVALGCAQIDLERRQLEKRALRRADFAEEIQTKRA